MSVIFINYRVQIESFKSNLILGFSSPLKVRTFIYRRLQGINQGPNYKNILG